MTTSSYLHKKYSAYQKDERAKVFTPEMVMEELLCNYSVAMMHIKEVLQKGHLSLTYFQFEKVICATIDLE